MMDLIERYLHELSRYLPKRLRTDVATELRSSLEEGVEAAVAGGSDPEMVIDAQLRELGPPDALAASYRGRASYVVGPELYPAFVKTYGLCVAVVGCLMVLAAVFGLYGAGLVDLVKMIGGLASDLLNTSVTLLGWVVLVFWIIGWSSEPKIEREAAWDPKSLPKTDDPDRVSRAGTAVGVFFLTAFILLMNFYPEGFVAIFGQDGRTVAVPLMGPGARAGLPLLNVGLIGSLLVLVAVIRRGRWNKIYRWVDLGFDLVTAAAMVVLCRSAELIQPGVDALTGAGWSVGEAQDLLASTMPVLETIVRAALGVGAAAIVVSVGVRVWKFLK